MYTAILIFALALLAVAVTTILRSRAGARKKSQPSLPADSDDIDFQQGSDSSEEEDDRVNYAADRSFFERDILSRR